MKFNFSPKISVFWWFMTCIFETFCTFGKNLIFGSAMITTKDEELLSQKGITKEQLSEQIESFEKGFPYKELEAAASVERGIMAPDSTQQQAYIEQWEDYQKKGKIISKFVPASGAASRMFKDLFAFLDAEYSEPQTNFEKNFVANLDRFAFYNALIDACLEIHDANILTLLACGECKTVVRTLLSEEGMNYGQLPKGLLLFHYYPDNPRTPVEEHMVEGALYASSKGKVHLHFTVSPEHHSLFEALVKEKKSEYEGMFNVRYDITFSEQKASTDTLAVDAQNHPLRTESGELMFRPGGHGALLENLNEQEADVIFIKNIDNVVPDRLKADTVYYKKLLAGVLVSLQQQIFEYLNLLESGKYTPEQIREIIQFLQKKLYCKKPNTKNLEDADLVLYLKEKLNRPVRVCGMVKNVGEPGGGPFLVYNTDGTFSLQILESSQIDRNDPAKKKMFEQGTYFNPVDLVCGVRNYKGEKFNLPDYVDKTTGFISHKSKNGQELKALELPGLWNGAMSDWNTVFVEVPLSTFNPVKTVNDLLRPEHQG